MHPFLLTDRIQPRCENRPLSHCEHIVFFPLGNPLNIPPRSNLRETHTQDHKQQKVSLVISNGYETHQLCSSSIFETSMKLDTIWTNQMVVEDLAIIWLVGWSSGLISNYLSAFLFYFGDWLDSNQIDFLKAQLNE